MRVLMFVVLAAVLAGAVAAGIIVVEGTLKTNTAQIGVIAPEVIDNLQGLVLYLPFRWDGGDFAFDENGNGHIGDAINCVWTNEGRYADGAMSFNRVDSKMTFSTVPDFPAWNTYSVSVWFKHDGDGSYGGYNSTYHKILSKSLNGGGQWEISVVYGYVCWYLSGNEGYCDLEDVSWGYADGLWHHVVTVRDGTDAQLWVDGNLMVTVNDMCSVSIDSDLCVGYSSTDPYAGWSGLIDEVRVYDHALSPKEIGQLHEVGQLIINPNTPASVGGDLTVCGNLTVEGAVNFSGGIRWLKPSGDLKQGNFMNAP